MSRSEQLRSTTNLLMALGIALLLGVPALPGQTAGSQSPSQPPANSQPAQEIPDAPSTVQPPPPKPAPAPATPPDAAPAAKTTPKPSYDTYQQPVPGAPDKTPQPSAQTPAGTTSEPTSQTGGPKNQIDPTQNLYKLRVSTNFVQIPVMVKDSQGRRVDGLLPKDFVVLENGKQQTLSYFTSDPFELSVAILLDLGMADVALQKINQTYGSLIGAFSPYDEMALYTYSSTVSQVADFTGRPERLTASLDQMKLVRGHSNGPPVMGGPLASGPTVNGAPVGGPTIQPVNTPPKEAHVLNDAILRAALDLSKRERTRRKVIFVISDGRERGSKASYSDVLRVLETQGIQVKAVVVDQGALPGFKQLEKLHLKGQGYGNILPRYTSATGGGSPFSELSRNAIEDAYAQITSEARNQYTLGYVPKAIASGSAYRSIEVKVYKKDLNIYTKAGYYPIPTGAR